jgi:NDP-sugar pyrophosphorylase family protein
MKSLIITVAGMSSRFNKDTREEVLKCLYFEDSPLNCLLSFQVRSFYDLFDEIIIVGGFKYDSLESFIKDSLPDPFKKIRLVYNEHYRDFGSCYSLVKGIQSLSDNTGEAIFLEGDLFFDYISFSRIVESRKDVVTINRDLIESDKSVVLYLDTKGFLHYLYDSSHRDLFIPEPFTAIYNSGQIWKFKDIISLKQIVSEMSGTVSLKGTNLEIVQRYFGGINQIALEIIEIDKWFNCNTIADYKKAVKAIGI